METAPAAVRVETRAQRRRTAVICGALTAMAPMSIDMYLPGMPAMTRDLGTTVSASQLTLTACLIGLAVGQLVVGPASDRLGRRRPLLVGLALYTAVSALCAITPSVEVLVILRLLQGAFGAAAIVVARAVVRDLYSGRDAARFYAQLMLVMGLAPVLAPLIGSAVLKVTSWRGSFVVLAGFGVALVLAVFFALAETLPPQRRRNARSDTTWSTFRVLARDRRFVGLALANGLTLGALFAYIAGSPFVLEDIEGVSPQLYGVIFGINALGVVASGQLSGRLVGRVRATTLLGWGTTFAAAGGLLLLLAVSMHAGLAGMLPALFLVAASAGWVLPNATALAMAEYPHMAGSASGLLGVLQFAVGAAAAPLVGIGGNGTAIPMGAVIATLGAGALLAFVVLCRPRPAGTVPASNAP
jgi:DHA1 family bicyclomycin/chloramphenicol resistance-like MFS transporter